MWYKRVLSYVTLKFPSTYRFLWGHELANSFLLFEATQFFFTDDYELVIQAKTTFFVNVAVGFTFLKNFPFNLKHIYIYIYIYIYLSGFDKRYLHKFLETVSFEACSVLDQIVLSLVVCCFFWNDLFSRKIPLKAAVDHKTCV